jgi:hypothetical protein
MSNLCVIDCRSSGSRRRTGRGIAATTASATACADVVLSFDVFSGCVRLLPSR